MIKLDKINLSFKKTIFNDFSYSFNNKGLYYLIGPSGCGKTTLLRLLYLNKYKYTGNIYFGEQNIKEMSISKIEEVRNDICYIPVKDNCFKSKSVEENYHLILGEDYNESLVNDVLKKVKLEKYKNRKVKTLSMGERQRFLLSIPLLTNKRIILLDELFSNLDEENALLFKVIYEELSTEKLVIIVEHEIKNISDKGVIIDFKNLESIESKEKCRYEATKKIKNKKYKFPILRLSVYFLIIFFMCLALSVFKIYGNTYMDVTEAKIKAYFNSVPIVQCLNSEVAEELGITDYKIDCYYTGVSSLSSSVIVEELYYNGENHTLKDNTIYIINYNNYSSYQYDIIDGKKLSNGITIKLIDVNEEFSKIGLAGPYFMNENTANIYFNSRLEFFNSDIDSFMYASTKLLESYNIISEFVNINDKLDLNNYNLGDDYFIAPFEYLEEKFGLTIEEYHQILNGDIEKEFTFDFPINGVVLGKTYKLLPNQVNRAVLLGMVFLPEDDYSIISPYKDEKPMDLLLKTNGQYYWLKDSEECRNIVLQYYPERTSEFILLNYNDYQLRYNDYASKIDTFRIVQFIFIGIALILLIISSIILDLNSKILFLYNYRIKYLTQKNLIISAIGFILFAILSVVFMKIMIETIFSSVYTIYHLSLTMFIEGFIYGVIFFIVSSLIVVFKNRYSFLHVR